MNGINTDELTEVKDLDVELYNEAKSFMENHSWCKSVVKTWYSPVYSIEAKLGVFLFEIVPASDNVDTLIWIIVGDIPSVYLDASIETGEEALEAYCSLMEEWSQNILEGNSLDDCYPVAVTATKENATLLLKRIQFIQDNLLTEE